MSLTTTRDFRTALNTELAEVDRDNPVAAVRAVARVARRFRPEAPTSWEAARWTAEELVQPHFERRDMDPAKAAVWAVCDPYYGQLERGSDTEERDDSDSALSPAEMMAALTGGGRE